MLCLQRSHDYRKNFAPGAPRFVAMAGGFCHFAGRGFTQLVSVLLRFPIAPIFPGRACRTDRQKTHQVIPKNGFGALLGGLSTIARGASTGSGVRVGGAHPLLLLLPVLSSCRVLTNC